VQLRDLQSLLVFGGSFDPPHIAHAALPRLARQRLGLDAVAYIPAGRAPHKLDRVQTDPAHRLAMTRLALADDPAALVLDVEAARDPSRPSYTVGTLAWLTDQLPADATMRLLIGTDQMAIFDTWKSADRVVRLAEPAVMVRPPLTLDSALGLVPAEQRNAWRPRLLELPQMPVSSTDIRQRVADGLPIDPLVAPPVADYIAEHGLYRTPT